MNQFCRFHAAGARALAVALAMLAMIPPATQPACAQEAPVISLEDIFAPAPTGAPGAPETAPTPVPLPPSPPLQTASPPIIATSPQEAGGAAWPALPPGDAMLSDDAARATLAAARKALAEGQKREVHARMREVRARIPTGSDVGAEALLVMLLAAPSGDEAEAMAAELLQTETPSMMVAMEAGREVARLAAAAVAEADTATAERRLKLSDALARRAGDVLLERDNMAERARMLEQAGRAPEGLRLMLAWERRQKNDGATDTRWLMQRGRCALAAGQTTLARESLERLAAEGNDEAAAPAWPLLGLLYELEGDMANAEQAYRRALQNSPVAPKTSPGAKATDREAESAWVMRRFKSVSSPCFPPPLRGRSETQTR